jgi:hypothetical protein
MEKDFGIEPGDVPDPVVGYSCDPVERVVVTLKIIALTNMLKLVALLIIAYGVLAQLVS